MRSWKRLGVEESRRAETTQYPEGSMGDITGVNSSCAEKWMGFPM